MTKRSGIANLVQIIVVGAVIVVGIFVYSVGYRPQVDEAIPPSTLYSPIPVVEQPVVFAPPNIVLTETTPEKVEPKVSPPEGNGIVYLTQAKDFEGEDQWLLLLNNKFHPTRKGSIKSSILDKGEKKNTIYFFDWSLSDVEESEKIPVATTPFQYSAIGDLLFSPDGTKLVFPIMKYDAYPYVRCFKDEAMTDEMDSCSHQERQYAKKVFFPTSDTYPKGYLVYMYDFQKGMSLVLFSFEDVKESIEGKLITLSLRDISPENRYLLFHAMSWCYACDFIAFEGIVFDIKTGTVVENIGRIDDFRWMENESGFEYKEHQWVACSDPDSLGTGDITSCWKDPEVIPWKSVLFNS